MLPSVDIFTCVTKLHPGYLNFKASFEQFQGWNVTAIGKGMPWKGWITRMILYRDTSLWVSQHKDPEHVIVFLDAYDILCVRDSQDFLKTFHEIGYPIVAGSENICFFLTCRPTTRWKKIHKIHSYINGGCIIGKAQAIYEAFRWCIEKGYHHDDQIALSYYMDRYPYQIYLDKSRFIFNDLFANSNVFQLEFPKKVSVSIKKQKYHPYFIHFPGLMVFSSSPVLFPWNIGKTPKNYKKIGTHIIGNEFMDYQPIHMTIYRSSMIFVISCCVGFVLLSVYLLWFLNKYRNNS